MPASDFDYTSGQSFCEGDRVELSPACDLWMQGAKFGTVTGQKNGIINIRMDNKRVRKLVRVKPEYLRHVWPFSGGK